MGFQEVFAWLTFRTVPSMEPNIPDKIGIRAGYLRMQPYSWVPNKRSAPNKSYPCENVEFLIRLFHENVNLAFFFQVASITAKMI